MSCSPTPGSRSITYLRPLAPNNRVASTPWTHLGTNSSQLKRKARMPRPKELEPGPVVEPGHLVEEGHMVEVGQQAKAGYMVNAGNMVEARHLVEVGRIMGQVFPAELRHLVDTAHLAGTIPSPGGLKQTA